MNDQDKQELRRLAEAATHGEWDYYCGQVRGDYDKDGYVVIAEAPAVKRKQRAKRDANMQLIAAANPAAVLSLLGENDQLRAEVESLRAQLEESLANDRQAMGYLSEIREIAGGYDFLATVRSVLDLKINAKRYETLRAMHWNESPLCVVANPKQHVRLGTDCPSCERLDAAIDAIMEWEDLK